MVQEYKLSFTSIKCDPYGVISSQILFRKKYTDKTRVSNVFADAALSL